MGLPPEPSKTGSFRKCHIYTFVINYSQLFEKKIFKEQQLPKTRKIQ